MMTDSLMSVLASISWADLPLFGIFLTIFCLVLIIKHTEHLLGPVMSKLVLGPIWVGLLLIALIIHITILVFAFPAILFLAVIYIIWIGSYLYRKKVSRDGQAGTCTLTKITELKKTDPSPLKSTASKNRFMLLVTTSISVTIIIMFYIIPWAEVTEYIYIQLLILLVAAVFIYVPGRPQDDRFYNLSVSFENKEYIFNTVSHALLQATEVGAQLRIRFLSKSKVYLMYNGAMTHYRAKMK